MKVFYNKIENKLIVLPDFLVSVKGRWVSTSSMSAIWRTRPELVYIGEL
jgi:hypothetical protein